MITISRLKPFQMRVLCVALLAAYPAWAEASIAGRVQFVAGDVQILDAAGKQRAAHKGDIVNEGETVLTATDSSAQLKLIDGGVVALRPSTQLKVVRYAFNGIQDGTENATFSLIKGGLRAITGLIGKKNKENYKLNTPTATIGIRGTDHEPVVVLPPLPGVQETTPPGTYDKVNVGATSLTTDAGAAFIAPNQVGFAAAANQPPVILPTIPGFYQATSTPQNKKNEKQEQKEKTQEKTQDSTQKTESKASSSDTAAADTGTTAVAAAPTSNLTATDADGNTLNLSQQTVKTASGESLIINDATTGRLKGSGTELSMSYPDNQSAIPHPAFYFAQGNDLAIVRDAAGNFTSFTNGPNTSVDAPGNSNSGKSSFHSTLSQVGSNLTDLGRDTATGLSWGRWQGGQLTQASQYMGQDAQGNRGLGGNDASGNFVIGGTETANISLGSSSLHWIAGSIGASNRLPQVLTGIVSYKLIGGTQPTDLLGHAGVLTSATLGVNFTTQIVDANVAFSIGSNSWIMQSGGMQLNGSRFSTFYNCNATACVSNVSLTENGVAVSTVAKPGVSWASGSFNGSLMGSGLNGASLQYSVQDNLAGTQVDPATGKSSTTFSNNVLQGVAALSGPVQDTATPYRVAGLEDGWGNGSDPFFNKGQVKFNASAFYHGNIDSGEQPVSRVVDSSAGLVELVGEAHGYTPLDPSSTVPTASEAGTPSTIKIGTAANRDVGSSLIGGTTISWGRWEGGTIDIYSRDGSIKLGTIDNTNRSVHWLTTSVLKNDFFALPLTGTAIYTLVGGTSPTDMKGNIGKLGAVTLNADFGNAKVNASLNVSFNSPTNTSNWDMTANNLPLNDGDGFKSSGEMNGVNGVVHTTTCTGVSCGPQAIGNLSGHFFGGGQGAVLTYGMTSGKMTGLGTPSAIFTPANLVSGVAVMKR